MSALDLEIVDGLTLSEAHQTLLRPNELMRDDEGRAHRLPRFFYAVRTWKIAHEIRLAPHFKLAELMTVDAAESDLLLREFPHYVPCGIVLLAGCLEAFRRAADATIFVSANGGYRSPAHRRTQGKSTHCWGTAADICRVGDTYLDDARAIAKFSTIAESLGAGVRVRAYAEGDDHLHLDLGFISVTPPETSEE